MGTAIETYTHKDCSTAELQQDFQRRREESLHMDGHDGYSGGIGSICGGLQIFNRAPFANGDAAEDFLDNHLSKRDAVAVRVLAPSAKSKAKSERLNAKLADLNSQKFQLSYHGKRAVFEDSVKRMKAAKSATKGCTACGSQIARRFIQATFCPICKDDKFVLTKADENKLNTIDSKIKKVEAEDVATQAALKALLQNDSNPETKWFVMALCPE
jgi:Zn finger protein HypA/HybF involved in hydrogenase expression